MFHLPIFFSLKIQYNYYELGNIFKLLWYSLIPGVNSILCAINNDKVVRHAISRQINIYEVDSEVR